MLTRRWRHFGDDGVTIRLQLRATLSFDCPPLKPSFGFQVYFRMPGYTHPGNSTRLAECFVLAVVLLTPALIAEQKVKMEDLPPAVQKAVKEQTRNVALVGLSKEAERAKRSTRSEPNAG
jgi:hypothetical protein